MTTPERMTVEQWQTWLRLVFAGPALMNPWFQFWLNSMAIAIEKPTHPPAKRKTD